MAETKESCEFKEALPLVSGPRILIARHGATIWNGKKGSSDDRVRGWADLPMTADGREESRQTAKILAGTGIQHVYTCPLRRTVMTGDMIAKAAGVGSSAVRALLPWNMGELQGQPAQEAKPLLRYYAEHVPGKKIPGGESFDDWRERALPWLRSLMGKVKRKELVICLVTHSRNINLVMGWLEGGMDEHKVNIEGLSRGGTEPGAIYDVRPDGDLWKGKLICVGEKP